jgi:opacity protein-like surface antigen
MKKVLVLSLVLVMALSSMAFAAVDFSGKFNAEIANRGPGFLDDMGVSGKLTVNIKAASGSDPDWSFEAESSLNSTEFALNKYLLSLNDDYFDLYFWGKGRELSDKGTALSMLKSAKKEANHRARLVVDAIEPVTLTVDFTSDKALYAFADVNISDDYAAGLAYKRNVDLNTIALWGKASIDMFTISGDFGATLGVPKAEENDEDVGGVADGDETGIAFGYGAKVAADITDELNVYAQYRGSQDGFDGDDWKKSEFKLGATYTETALKVAGTFTMDLEADSNTLKVEGYYRFSDTLGYDDLFDGDEYFNNDAPAAGLVANLKDFGVQDVTLLVASPVVEDMVWARADAKWAPVKTEEEDGEGETVETTKHTFEVGAYAYVKATEKLTIEPSVIYKTEDSVIDLKGVATYKIGASDVALTLTAQKVMADEGATDEDDNAIAKEVLKAAVEVKF